MTPRVKNMHEKESLGERIDKIEKDIQTIKKVIKRTGLRGVYSELRNEFEAI